MLILFCNLCFENYFISKLDHYSLPVHLFLFLTAPKTVLLWSFLSSTKVSILVRKQSETSFAKWDGREPFSDYEINIPSAVWNTKIEMQLLRKKNAFRLVMHVSYLLLFWFVKQLFEKVWLFVLAIVFCSTDKVYAHSFLLFTVSCCCYECSVWLFKLLVTKSKALIHGFISCCFFFFLFSETVMPFMMVMYLGEYLEKDAVTCNLRSENCVYLF